MSRPAMARRSPVRAGQLLLLLRRRQLTGLEPEGASPGTRSALAPLRWRFERLFNAGNRRPSRHAPYAARELRRAGGGIRPFPDCATLPVVSPMDQRDEKHGVLTSQCGKQQVDVDGLGVVGHVLFPVSGWLRWIVVDDARGAPGSEGKRKGNQVGGLVMLVPGIGSGSCEERRAPGRIRRTKSASALKAFEVLACPGVAMPTRLAGSAFASRMASARSPSLLATTAQS